MRLPTNTRASFDALLGFSCSAPRTHENEASPAGVWLTHFGHTIGVRVPSADERARVFALLEYAQALGLTQHELFSAIGNAFDPEIIAIGIGQAVVAGLQEETPCLKQEYLSPRAIIDLYAELLRVVRSNRPVNRTLPSPLPIDLAGYPQRVDAIIQRHRESLSLPHALVEMLPLDGCPMVGPLPPAPWLWLDRE